LTSIASFIVLPYPNLYIGTTFGGQVTTDAKETTTEAVDDGKETNKKDKCGDCSEKCGGKEAKETVKDITDN